MPEETRIQGPLLKRAVDCEPILKALPAWFGIPSAVQQYLVDINRLPTFLAMREADVIGFLTLTIHNYSSAEIHVMGVMPTYHRLGIGAKMIRSAEQHLVENGCEYLQVKTLSAKDTDPNYALTRKFYEKMGFRPLQEWPELWGPDNPCVQLIKTIVV